MVEIQDFLTVLLVRDPEFARTPRVSPERLARGRELPSLTTSCVISSSQWGRIREAARAFTKEEASVLAIGEPGNEPQPR